MQIMKLVSRSCGSAARISQAEVFLLDGIVGKVMGELGKPAGVLVFGPREWKVLCFAAGYRPRSCLSG